MAAPITTINPRGINTTGDYVVNSISSTGNVSAGNIKTDHLLHANGDPYVFTSNAAGTNTQVQFNDGNSFAGSAKLTFDKTTGTLTANFFVGDGSNVTNVNALSLSGHSASYFATSTQGTKADSAVQPGANISVFTNDSGYLVAGNLSSYATKTDVGNSIANLVNSAPGVLDTLGELANAIGNDASFVTTITNSLANKANTSSLSTVALSGNYQDLNNKPTLFDGTYANLTGKPTLFDGEYASLANKPTLFSGSYVDLTNKPTLFDGEYASLANKPSLFSGSYTDLTNKPTLGTAASTNANAYATAAQGSKADTALQPANLTGYATETYVTNAIANIPATDLTSYATKTDVGNSIANLVASAPAALDTLNELANALGNDANYSTTITNALANKLSTSSFNSTANTWLALQTTSNVTEGTNLYYTVTRANTAIDNRVTKSFVDALGINASSLNGHSDTYFATSTQGTKADSAVQPGANISVFTNDSGYLVAANISGKANTADLATVAISGNYSDLLNKPTLFSGSYTDLTNKPTLGTAAATNANAYATAAQGAKADTAIQSGANISVFTNDSGYLVAANLTTYATKTYVDSGIANLVASAPAALDTLNELANALGNDANYSTTITNALANKLSTSNFATTANTWISTQTTSNLAEGTNLYYTAIRANSAIDARVTKSFVDTLGVTANIANIAYSVSGANVSGAVQYAAIANSVAGSNVVGQVSNSTIAGTVYTNAQPNITSVGTLTSLTVTGNITSGNVSGGNLVSANYISGNGSLLSAIAGANVTGIVGNATHANVSDAANSVAVANVTGIGNIATINKDGNSSNVLYGNGVFASAPVTYANSNVANYLPTYTGNLTPGNIIISSDNLKLSGGTANYVLSTDGTGNLSWVQQSSGNGSSSSTVSTVTSVDTFNGDGTTTIYTLSVTPQSINQTFINYNGALQLRNAYTLSGANITFSEAPANGSVIEVTTQMGVTSGSGNLTVRNYTSDGSLKDYSVSAGVNATNILVTENGLLQTPTVDYTVSNSILSFVTAPGLGVKIQIRELGVAVATITPAGSNTQVLFNDAGQFGNSSQFTFSKSSNTLTVANLTVSSIVGNLVPSANVTYNLGSATQRWKDLFLSGNTIDLAGAKIKSDPTTGSIAFVPPTTVASPNPTALVISPSGAISTSVTTNGVLASNAFSAAITTGTVTSPRYISMVKTGNITTPNTGTSRYYPPSNVQIRGVTASLSNASSDTFTFVINKNGSNAGAFSISASQHQLSSTSANISLTTTDYLTIDISNGTGAADLRIDLEYTVV